MSRVAKYPVEIPTGVEVELTNSMLKVKGSRGSLHSELDDAVTVTREENSLRFAAKVKDQRAEAMAGTLRALARNMITGVSNGFEKRLELQGVGYRAQAQGRRLDLQLGFSHPVQYPLPEGITAETPSQTEIVIKGVDKQLVGQVAAEIRGYRPPEPYKGKGVRYVGERVRRKEAKKK
jgi:large subunit ribosomal protein L6